jgi:hypothetical protein
MPEAFSRRAFVGRTVAGLSLGVAATGEVAADESPAAPAEADLPPRTLITAPPLRPVPEWVRTHQRFAHLPPPDWKMIEAHLKAGVTSLTVNMDSRWSKVGPAASLYAPDVVKEADETMRRYVARVHAAGAKAIFYIGPVHVPFWNAAFRQAHPDWLIVNADGKPGQLANFRSGYGDWLAAQLAYVVRSYSVDGFWFDGYSGQQYSYDPTSQRLFQVASGGHAIPNHIDPRDGIARQYLHWFWQGYVDFADRLRGVIRQENPDAVVFANYSACREWVRPDDLLVEYPACYANAVDLPSVEQYWDNPGDALHQQFIAAFTEGVSHNRGATIWMQPQAFGTVGLAPEVEFRLRYLVSATRGVYTEFVEPTGREEYARMWAADMKAREEWLKQSEPLPWIGLVVSEQTKMLYGGPTSLVSYFSHALGAFRALMEAHRPVRILTEYDLEDNALQGVKVLVLPNVACLSDRATEVIRRFVRQGGGLVATYETSLFDHTGTKRPDFALKDLFHAEYAATRPVLTREEALPLTLASRHTITDDPILAQSRWTSWTAPDDPGYGRLMMVAGAVQARSVPGAETIVHLREKVSASETWPAALAIREGRGRVVYFPAAVDWAMCFYPAAHLRQLLRNACDWAAAAPPPVEVQAPYILAVTYRMQPEQGRLVVHLLNDASSWGRHSAHLQVPGHSQSSELRGTWPLREELIPIRDIKVLCRQPGIKQATLAPEGLRLPLKRVAGGVEVTVPEVTLHSMVVLE